MGSTVEEAFPSNHHAFSPVTALNSDSQIISGSKSSLLTAHIEFRHDDDEEDSMSGKFLQDKYHLLVADHKNTNLNEKAKLNGQLKGSNLMNGARIDSDGPPKPKIVLCLPDKVVLEWKQLHKIGAGLANLGNTCFMNSVLQCLSYCPPLINFLLYNEEDHQSKCILNAFCMTCELQRHVKRAYNHSGESIKPLYIYQRLKSIAKHFTFGRQEDAHEFLRYVIDNMWRSCVANYEANTNHKLDPLSKETTIINKIFGGYHRSQVICLQCKEKSNTYDYFMDFMLDVKNVNSLETALHRFVQPEILQQENAYKCPRCKRKVPAKKLFTVFTAPNVATFQLKRFDYNRIFGGKITKLISYPEKLDLRPFMSEKQGAPIYYKLNAVLVHLGPTCNSGHYFCYVKNSNNFWYLMDDSRVCQVNLNQVLNQQAYVLFYVRLSSDFNKPNPVKNCYVAQSYNKTTPFSSPELSHIHQNYHHNNGLNINLQNGVSLASTGKISPSPNLSNQMVQPANSLNFKLKYPPTIAERLKHSGGERSPKPVNNKGLVPYLNDSSDEESIKQEEDHEKSCENVKKEAPYKNSFLNNTEELHQNPITNSAKINSNHSLSLSENNSMGVAPLTLKVKATTSSWHVVETCLRSPSVASGESTNSVNSTTEWTVTDCNSDGHHSKIFNHNKIKAKGLPLNNSAPCSSNNKKSISEEDTIKEKSDFKINEKKKEESLKIGSSFDLNSSFDSKMKNEGKESESLKPQILHKNIENQIFNLKEAILNKPEAESKNLNFIDKSPSPTKLKQKKHKHKTHQNHSSDSESSIGVKKIKKKHKKKKKKHKKKHDKSSDESSSEEEFEWVERTKETVEREQNATKLRWDEDVRDLVVKRKRSMEQHVENAKNSSVDILLTSGRGFGNQVTSWSGGPNHLDSSLSHENGHGSNYDEHYNDDYDKGKTKKMRLERDNRLYNRKNEFQKTHEFKHRNNGEFSHRKSWDRRYDIHHSRNHFNYYKSYKDKN